MNFVTHKNVLSTYLSSWHRNIHFLPRPRKPEGPISGHANVFRAISSGERDIGILLRLLDERLLVLEVRPPVTIDNIHELDFRADAEAIVLLKALYVQIRMYLDAIAGVIRYFYRRNNLPLSFNDLLKKVGTLLKLLTGNT